MKEHYLSWHFIYTGLDRRHTFARGRTPLDNVPRLRNVVIGRYVQHVPKTDGAIATISSAFSPFDCIDHYYIINSIPQ